MAADQPGSLGLVHCALSLGAQRWDEPALELFSLCSVPTSGPSPSPAASRQDEPSQEGASGPLSPPQPASSRLAAKAASPGRAGPPPLPPSREPRAEPEPVAPEAHRARRGRADSEAGPFSSRSSPSSQSFTGFRQRPAPVLLLLFELGLPGRELPGCSRFPTSCTRLRRHLGRAAWQLPGPGTGAWGRGHSQDSWEPGGSPQ